MALLFPLVIWSTVHWRDRSPNSVMIGVIPIRRTSLPCTLPSRSASLAGEMSFDVPDDRAIQTADPLAGDPLARPAVAGAVAHRPRRVARPRLARPTARPARPLQRRWRP